MAVLHLPCPSLVASDEHIEAIISERRDRGLDRHDECWDGEYVIMPEPRFVHQLLVTKLVVILSQLTDETVGDVVLPGWNVSDRIGGWKKNFRCPDVLVYLAGTTAELVDTHSVGGPDLAVEILSPGDRTYEKLDFYGSVGTRELIVIDTDDRKLELFRGDGATMNLVSTAVPGEAGFQTETVSAEWAVPSDAGMLSVTAGGVARTA